ncbi:DUF3794 domain-containing protein [Clostridioides difficile]|uniref:DUF3794 domain-containing protein n=1 Tax=Clostridioides difficile TaxID=1496 RepID=UPI000C9CAA3C|nr:DUF3794 domain-containing protein [Clostridioides difficile]MCM0742777.1 DUF3794 domain-containing protein [Clostridioides difficile]MCM0746596.1 DUF3794 domain-containing protein [Clostridioides difficile]MCP8365434.1 DUF3794 domain-containing protein [Clostridioides difficile]MCP8369363.1 DUF3794 domain-containing protein [Clostridioides difficile]MCP8381573.1 DUF3794 domain-containing protein [Clostridioides difficile]
MNENISTTGITSLEDYPKGKCKKYYKEFIEDDILCIPTQKPDIECINEVSAKICIEDKNIINTILGPKLVIQGFKNIKIIYTADNCQQSLHSAHWSIPFCKFILLEDLCYDKCDGIIESIFIGIENICVKYFDCRMIDLSLLFIICPQICNCNNCKYCRNYCMYNPNLCYYNTDNRLDNCNTTTSKHNISDKYNSKIRYK